MSADTLCWTDIPVTNLDRAVKFYSAVLGQKVKKLSEAGMEYGLLPHEEQNASGCLCVRSDSGGLDNRPSANGPLIYLLVEGALKGSGRGGPRQRWKSFARTPADRRTRISRGDYRFRRESDRPPHIDGIALSGRANEGVDDSACHSQNGDEGNIKVHKRDRGKGDNRNCDRPPINQRLRN